MTPPRLKSPFPGRGDTDTGDAYQDTVGLLGVELISYQTPRGTMPNYVLFDVIDDPRESKGSGANKRKAASESESNDAYDAEPDSDTAEREAECDSHPDEAQLSDSFEFPTPADLVPKRRSRSRKRQAFDTDQREGKGGESTGEGRTWMWEKDKGVRSQPSNANQMINKMARTDHTRPDACLVSLSVCDKSTARRDGFRSVRRAVPPTQKMEGYGTGSSVYTGPVSVRYQLC
ncbi:hypothetical protein B0H13DRAFT_1867968 [Mycena leptocephala]|nr:hypothetical protein B0H13DRAFT_1867968 [Mycena leptocephala]